LVWTGENFEKEESKPGGPCQEKLSAGYRTFPFVRKKMGINANIRGNVPHKHRRHTSVRGLGNEKKGTKRGPCQDGQKNMANIPNIRD